MGLEEETWKERKEKINKKKEKKGKEEINKEEIVEVKTNPKIIGEQKCLDWLYEKEGEFMEVIWMRNLWGIGMEMLMWKKVERTEWKFKEVLVRRNLRGLVWRCACRRTDKKEKGENY